jgi:hypothetical protein
MTTQSELLSGVTILSASLLMRAVSAVSPVGMFRDLWGVFSVVLLVAGVGVVAVGLAHRVLRARGDARADYSDPMSSETSMATGAVVGVGIGCTIGAMYGAALSVAIGTAVGAAVGVAAASQWRDRGHPRH